MKRLLVLALLLAACGARAGRALVLVEVDTDGVNVDAVRIELTPKSGGLVAETFPVTGGVLRAGVYLPAGVSGTVSVRAVGMLARNDGPTSAPQTITVVAAGTAGPVALSLSGSVAGPDAGVVVDAAVVAPDAGVSADGPAVDGAPPGPDWRAPVSVDDDVTRAANYPALAVDPRTGNALLTWVDATAARVRRYDAQKDAWDDVKALDVRGQPTQPHVGIDGRGQAMVVWAEGNMAEAALQGVWVSQSTDQIAWSPPVRIVTGYVPALELAVSGGGSARVVYQIQTDSTDQLGSAYFDGQSWQAPVIVNAPMNATPEGDTIRMAIDNGGHGVVAWTLDDGTLGRPYGATFSGPTLSPMKALEPNLDKGATVTDAIMNGDGRGMVVWTLFSFTSGSTASTSALYPGADFGSPTPFMPGLAPERVGLTIDRAGTIVACWAQNDANRHPHVWSSRLPVGGAWSVPVALEITNTRGDTDGPDCHLAVDGRNDVQAIFRQVETTAKSTDAFSLFGARWDAATGTWSPARKLAGRDDVGLEDLQLGGSDSGLFIGAYRVFDPLQTAAPDTRRSFAMVYR